MENSNFIQDFIEKVLNEKGFSSLNEVQKQEILPRFTAEAERRIGIALMPELTVENAENLAKMLEDKNTNPEALWNFLNKNIIGLPNKIQSILKDFADEILNNF